MIHEFLSLTEILLIISFVYTVTSTWRLSQVLTRLTFIEFPHKIYFHPNLTGLEYLFLTQRIYLNIAQVVETQRLFEI